MASQNSPFPGKPFIKADCLPCTQGVYTHFASNDMLSWILNPSSADVEWLPVLDQATAGEFVMEWVLKEESSLPNLQLNRKCFKRRTK